RHPATQRREPILVSLSRDDIRSKSAYDRDPATLSRIYKLCPIGGIPYSRASENVVWKPPTSGCRRTSGISTSMHVGKFTEKNVREMPMRRKRNRGLRSVDQGWNEKCLRF